MPHTSQIVAILTLKNYGVKTGTQADPGPKVELKLITDDLDKVAELQWQIGRQITITFDPEQPPLPMPKDAEEEDEDLEQQPLRERETTVDGNYMVTETNGLNGSMTESNGVLADGEYTRDPEGWRVRTGVLPNGEVEPRVISGSAEPADPVTLAPQNGRRRGTRSAVAVAEPESDGEGE